MAKDKNGKLTYEMKSPGDAWMDHVEKHHGASAVTPSYLQPDEKSGAVQDLQKRMVELEKQMDGKGENREQQLEKHIDKLLEKKQGKDKGKEKDPGKELTPSR